MSILDKSSLVMIPSGYKEDVLYSVKPRNGEGDFTFTRASTGTRVNADGLIEEVPWNLNNNSENLNSYTKLNVVVTSDDIISPRGTQDADKLETTSNNSYKLLKTNSVSFVSGVDYTFSFYAKKGTTDFIQLITTNTLFGAISEWANFDLNNGVVSLDNYGGASIEDVGNGWFRCLITSTCVSSGTDGWYVSVITSGTSTRAETTSNVVDVYVWGVQLVKGTSLKPYIKTTDRLDIPRLDYSGGATTPTLLLEGQRTNTILNSEDLSQNTILNNASVTTDQTTSPSNIDNADKVTFGSGSGFFYKQTTISAASTFSVFLKYDDYQYFQLMGTGDVDHYANFDILNGVLGNVGSQATAKIEDYGNGWYRCSLSMYAGTFAGGQRVYKTNSLTASWAGGGGGAGSVFAWGMQLESGIYETSYIPTLSTSVTRVADVCEDAGNSTTFNDAEGVLFVEISALADDQTSRGITIDGSGSTENRVIIQYQPSFSNKIRALLKNNDNSSVELTYVLSDITDYAKIAFKYKSGDLSLWVNGVERDTSSDIIFLSNLQELSFDNGRGSNNFYGKCKQLIYFNQALTDDELETLTTI